MARTKSREEILVYAHWSEMKKPILMGVLYVEIIRGKEIFSFEYSKEWLKSNYAQIIDPDLLLHSGPQYTQDDRTNFGIFLDSSPDRWGRILMKRREAATARQGKRNEKTLKESDFLLGVYDEHRMGGLRFKMNENGPFLNSDRKFVIPPWTSLRELGEISLKIENDDLIDDPDYINWLNMLIAPGSSLGGARPKASVIDSQNNLWIAKFPSSHDERDIGAWEMVVNILAHDIGLNIPVTKVENYANKHHTFLSKRFDRSKNIRIHFASAMTMLGYNGGTNASDGLSYLELVDFISANGAKVKEDLEELWKRIVFSICVTNTDDHLRNHGFILTDEGWILSPAFDINPIENGTGLKLNISETDNSLDFDLALDVVDYFRIERRKAEKMLNQIKEEVKKWEIIADGLGISKAEKSLMAKAFKVK